MTSPLHTIRRQTLKFQYNGKADGFALQKEVSDWCNFNLIPEIEQQLDLLELGDNYFTIDKLEIEATANNNDWQQKIRDELIFSLKQKLNDLKPKLKKEDGILISGVNFEKKEKVKLVSGDQKLDELILYYFATGHLPWWGKSLISDDFKIVMQNWIRQDFSNSQAEFIRYKMKQTASENLIKRIQNQVPQELFFPLILKIYSHESEIINQIKSFLNELLENILSVSKQKAITASVNGFLLGMLIENEEIIHIEPIVEFIYQEAKKLKTLPKTSFPAARKTGEAANPINEVWQKMVIQEELRPGIEGKLHPSIEVNMNSDSKLIPEETKMDEVAGTFKKFQYNKLIDRLTDSEFSEKMEENLAAELKEGIYVDNAGAVIFAAFLPALFKQLEIEKNGLLQNPDLAAMLIQYCVTGNAKISEYDLVLPKILSGIEIDFPVNTNIKITANQKREVDEMLISLIEYWSVLKNTSIDGLRDSFLKRNGKLTRVNKEWLLQVEQKSYDMLLLQLPWSISMIKLPWMKNLLKTEWA